MTPRPTRTKTVQRERHAIYWQKAMEFFETMVDASQKRNWNAAGSAGVHCCIAATDALLVKHAGLRSSSDAHQDCVGLLQARLTHPELPRQARRLAGILAQKNVIEYADRLYTEKDALALKLSVERFVEWARRLL